MDKKGLRARVAVGVIGSVFLLGAAGSAYAAEVEDGEVEVKVEIAALPPVGALTMSVAADSAALTEVETLGDSDIRQFNGTLPTVTVADDRTEVPDGVYWYVTGQSSAFTAAGAPEIGPDQLGWAPRLITEGDGEVIAGDEVVTSLDDPTQGAGASANNVGLVGEELLALALDSSDAHAVGEWEANADLMLKTPKAVQPGSYSATVTLTLWEDSY